VVTLVLHPNCYLNMTKLSGREPLVIWSMWMMTFVTFIFVCLRLYTRAIMVRSVGWDDYLINFCWVCDWIAWKQNSALEHN